MSSPSEWYGSLPTITKAWLTSAVASGLALRLELVNPHYILLDWELVFKRFEVSPR